MNIEIKDTNILVIEDDSSFLTIFKLCLDDIHSTIPIFANSLVALEKIKQESFDLIFLNIDLQPLDGFTILGEIKKFAPNTSVIVITRFDQFDRALKALDMGAYQILQKPIEKKELLLFIKKATEYHQIKTELREIKSKFYSLALNSKFITQNKDLLKNVELAEQMAASEINILILGESGTGKELIAEFIHEKSLRANKPLIKVNCAAIPEGLLESELFGHVKGAFTGAIKDRVGRFELADGGTIFLDEIGEMPLAFQSKLLRVLQTKEFESVGDSKTKKVNVRILAATNINIEAAIQEKTFREDLFYRLNGVSIKIIPLRKRPEDIELLIQHFIQIFSKNRKIEITDDTLFLLKSYHWRGNVRELENTIHHAVILAKDNLIDISRLPEEFRNPSLIKMSALLSLEDMEKIHISKVLSYTADLKEAASVLKIDAATLWRKRKRYAI
ncbi:MAG: sigma-54-dependent Fis family transcriptional regulator [Leptospiraceae bacterium]|nr:sigma-54-dependent Fis family transcriptional regulator [Leptospiraceae bacterium]